MTDFEKCLDKLLEGAKDKREYHGEARKAFNDVVTSGAKFKRALTRLSEVQSKFKNESEE